MLKRVLAGLILLVGLQSAAVADGIRHWQRSFSDQVVSVRAEDYGFTAGGTAANNALALDAAVQALPAKGGTLYIKPGAYNFNATWNWDRAVNLVCESYGDDSSASSTSGTEATTLTWTGSGSNMVNIISPTASNYLFGGSIKGCVFSGGNAALRCVSAHSISNWEFDFKCRQVTTEGFRIDDSNGVISQFNYIRRYQFVYGSAVGVEGATGLIIAGTASNIGATQTQADWVQCLIKNGSCVVLADSDNNHLRHIHSARAVGGTGYGLDLQNGSTALHSARNNLIDYMVGAVHAASQTRGNRISHLVSEASSVAIDAGGQLIYCVLDRTHGGLYCTPGFKKTDTVLVNPTEITLVSAAATASRGISSLYASLNLLEGQTAVVGITIPPDPRWDDGTITSIKFTYAMTTAANGNVELAEKMSTLTSAGATTTTEVSETNTFTAPAATNTIATYTWTPASPLAFTKGDYLLISFTRTSGSGGDTATGNFAILGLEITYLVNDPADGAFANPPIEYN